MKIVHLETTLVELPLRRPIGTAIHAIRSVGCVLVELETDDGVVGQSFVFTINADRLRAFDEMVRGLSPFVVGRDPHESGRIWSDLWLEVNPTGHKGVTIAAMSAIDIACWDLVGRALNTPLHKLFGACRESVSTYASSGLWLSDSIDDLQAEAASFVAAGFRAMKLRVGSDRLDDDLDRIRAVRDAIGPDVGLLVDANQRFTPKQAIRLGRHLDEFDLVWFEEPVLTHDLRGCAEVRSALDTPIATGETEYTRYGMKALVDAGAADVLMPDLQRIGGYSECRTSAAFAATNDLPVSTHFFTEYSLALAGSTANCISVEHIDWFAPLFNERPELHEGNLVIPDRPGTGFTFAGDVTAEFPLL